MNNESMSSSRRAFLGAAITAASYQRVLGANDRVRVGFIGCGLIGLRHIADFKNLPDAELTAVCDVYEPRIGYAQEKCGSSPKGYKDFRKMLEDKNVDAVVISTPAASSAAPTTGATTPAEVVTPSDDHGATTSFGENARRASGSDAATPLVLR